MLRRQRKHLHQLPTTTMLPSLLGHTTAIPQHLKPTEQVHLKALHQQTIFSPNHGARKSTEMSSPGDAAHFTIGSFCGSDNGLPPTSCRTETAPLTESVSESV
jgi:hypothetical protein